MEQSSLPSLPDEFYLLLREYIGEYVTWSIERKTPESFHLRVSHRVIQVTHSPTATARELFDACVHGLNLLGFRKVGPPEVTVGGQYVVPSEFDQRDFIYEPHYVSLPREYDLRPLLEPVRDQGISPMCLPFTICGIREFQEKREINLQEYFSPQFLYNQRRFLFQGQGGMVIREGLSLAHKVGLVFERYYPIGCNLPITDELLKLAFPFRLKAYARILTPQALKQSLYRHGPALAVFKVRSFNPEFWKGSMDGELHAVSIVGWTRRGFIIRNSWGVNWGNQGYSYLPESDFCVIRELWSLVDAVTDVSLIPYYQGRYERVQSGDSYSLRPLPPSRFFLSSLKNFFGFK